MLLKSRRSRTRSGAVAVETAVVLPVLTLMMIGLWEIGRLVEAQQVLSNAAREGGRRASVGASQGNSQSHLTDISTLCTNYVGNAGLPKTNVQVKVYNKGQSGASAGSGSDDPTSAVQSDYLLVTVSIPLDDVRWVLIGKFMNTTSNLTGQSLWLSMKDDPVSVGTTLPQG